MWCPRPVIEVALGRLIGRQLGRLRSSQVGDYLTPGGQVATEWVQVPDGTFFPTTSDGGARGRVIQRDAEV